MRLTTLCVCGTLLALSSWIRAEDGPHLGDRGLGPCAASLIPGGACRPGQRDSTCPYLLSLPPLTVHLPRHLRELENIMQDLQKLKDSVEELRKMCADCTESRAERKCVGQRDKEQERQNEGKSEDVRSWMNVRLGETGRSFKQEGGNNGEKVGKTDGDNSEERSLIQEEKGRNKWGADRKSNRGVVKENERVEAPTGEEERDEKTRKEAARGEERLEQEKVPTAGGNTRTVDVTREEVSDTTHRETTDLLDALKGNLKGFQEDKLENAEDRKMSANVKRKEKTKEDSDLYVWRDEINKTDKKTKTEASDGIKMSENHEENINKVREQHREETRKEKGIKVDQNNEKLKDAESTGHTEKEKAIKEGEEGEKGREMGTEIKTKSVQRNGDGVLPSRKTTEGTDFSSVSPTLRSTTKLASNLDPNKVTIFTSSLPSPPLPSSTLSSITDVIRDTKDVYGSTQSTGLGAADILEPEGHDAGLASRTAPGGEGPEITGATTGLNSAFTAKPGAGLQGYERSTTTSPTFTAPRQKLNTTASPRVTDHRSWTPKKNVSSNIKTGLKPPPGRALSPGDKHKPGIKPEAEQKLKNPKNDRKPNHAPAPDKKTKYNQKQKPPPASEKPKPGNNSENIHNSKFIRKTPPQISATSKNARHNLTHPSPKNKLPFQIPVSARKFPTSIQKAASQRPQTVNTSRSDKEPSVNKQHAPGKTAIIHQNLKSDTRSVHSFKTNQPDQKETPEKHQTKPEEKFDLRQNLKAQSGTKRSQTESFTAKPNQQRRTESVETSDENPLQEPESNSNVRSGQKITSNAVNVSFDQMNKSSQEIPERKPKLKPVQEPKNKKSETATMKPNKRLPETVEKLDENPLEGSNLDLIPGPKITFNATFDQTNKSSQEISKIKPKPKEKSLSKTEPAAPKHNKQPSTESETKPDKNPVPGPEPDQDLLSGHKTTLDQLNATSDQINTSSQETPKTEHQPKLLQEPKTKSETGTLNPNQKPLTEDKSAENSSHEPESNQDLNYRQTTSSRVTATSDQMKTSSEEMSRTKPKTKPELTEEPTSETESAIPKPDRKPSAESVFNKDAARKPESNQDVISGQKFTSNQVNATTEQITSGEGISQIKHQPKPDQETNKSKTGALNPNRKPLAENKSVENHLQEHESHQDLNYKPTNASSRVTATSDQKPESSQETLINKHKPKPNQELKPKTETTPKPDQIPSTASVVDKKPSHEPEQDSLPGEKNTSDQVDATLDQRTDSNQDKFNIKPKPDPNQEPKKRETATLEPKQKPLTESAEKSGENPLQEAESNKDSTSGQTHAPDKAKKVPVPKFKPIDNVPNVNKRPRPGPEPKQKLNHPKAVTGLKTKPSTNVHTERAPQRNSSLKRPRPEQTPELKPPFKTKNTLTAKTNRTTEPRAPSQHRPSARPLIKPGAKPVQRPKPPVQPKPSPKTNKTRLDPPKISWAPSENIPNSQPDIPSTSGSAKQIPEVTHSPRETDFSTSTRKTVSQGPRTSDSLDWEHSPRLHTPTEDFPLSPNSRTVSDLRPQTARQPPSIPMTTRPNKIHRGLLHRVITSTSPGSTQTSPGPKADFSAQDKIHYNREETAPANPILSPSLETTSTPSPGLSSTTRAASGFEPSATEPTTPSARELRVRIKQVAAFANNSLNPNGRVGLSKPHLEGSQRGSGPDTKRPTSVQTKGKRFTRFCMFHFNHHIKTHRFSFFCKTLFLHKNQKKPHFL